MKKDLEQMEELLMAILQKKKEQEERCRFDYCKAIYDFEKIAKDNFERYDKITELFKKTEINTPKFSQKISYLTKDGESLGEIKLVAYKDSHHNRIEISFDIVQNDFLYSGHTSTHVKLPQLMKEVECRIPDLKYAKVQNLNENFVEDILSELWKQIGKLEQKYLFEEGK